MQSKDRSSIGGINSTAKSKQTRTGISRANFDMDTNSLYMNAGSKSKEQKIQSLDNLLNDDVNFGGLMRD